MNELTTQNDPAGDASLTLSEPRGPGFERHIPELDGIRGAAVVAVVFYHLALPVKSTAHGAFSGLLQICLLGNFGVDAFFALSGFLITRILLGRRNRPHYFRNFYLRRVLRLMPPYLLTLALVVLLIPHSGQFLLLSLLYVANLFSILHVKPSYGPLWSLSVEEQFYFIWPALLFLMSKRSMLLTSLAICVASPLLRLFVAYDHGFEGDAVFLSWFRFDGLAWGALLAIFIAGDTAERVTALFLRSVALIGILLGIAGLAITAEGFRPQGFSLLYSVAPMLTVVLIGASLRYERRSLGLLRSKALRFFGNISYWVYLVHWLILIEVERLFQIEMPEVVRRGGAELWLLLTTCIFAGSILSGIAVRRWIELPSLRLKSRF